MLNRASKETDIAAYPKTVLIGQSGYVNIMVFLFGIAPDKAFLA